MNCWCKYIYLIYNYDVQTLQIAVYLYMVNTQWTNLLCEKYVFFTKTSIKQITSKTLTQI